MFRGGPELAGAGLPWPGETQRLLLLATIGPEDGVHQAFASWQDATDIEAPVDGGTYRLLPMLYARLSAQGIDDPLLGRLKGVYRRAWYDNNRLFHRVAPALAALNDAGIPTMLMKGVPIAFTHHDSHALRPMADIDLMVREERAQEARHILGELGWIPTAKHPPHELPDLHAQDLRNPDGVEIDLHWQCLREVPSAAVDDWFWSTARPLTFQGVETLQPAPTPMLVQILLHGLRSNLEPPIRWISDAAALMRGSDEIDWQGLVDFARRHRLSHRLSLGLRYLADTFAQPVPPWVVEALEAEGVSFIERMENVVCLGPADRMYSPYLWPLTDYWRYRRVRGRRHFWQAMPAYLTRRWKLDHPAMIPVAAAAILWRRARRR